MVQTNSFSALAPNTTKTLCLYDQFSFRNAQFYILENRTETIVWKHKYSSILVFSLFHSYSEWEITPIKSHTIVWAPASCVSHFSASLWINVTGGVCWDLGFVELQLVVCDSPGLFALQLLRSFLLHVIFSQLIWLDHLSKLCQTEWQTQELSAENAELERSLRNVLLMIQITKPFQSDSMI